MDVITAIREVNNDVIKMKPINKALLLLLALFLATAFAVLIPFFLHSQNTFISITATGQKNPLSKGSEVWITDFGGVSKIDLPKGWERRGAEIVSYKNQPSTFTWEGNISGGFIIDLVRHPWSGIVEVSVNGVSRKYDLYNSNGGTLSLSPYEQLGVFYPLIHASLRFKVKLIFLSIILFFILPIAFIYLSNILNHKLSWISKLDWLWYATPCIIVYTIYLLAFYPGIMTNDSITQWNEMLTLKLDDLAPVFHTLTNWVLTRLYLSPASVALGQILALSIVVGFIMQYFKRQGAPRWVLYLCVALYALAPINGLFVITLWKDIPYAISVLWLTYHVLRIIQSGGVWLDSNLNRFALAVSLLFVAFYEHNGIAAALGTIIVLLVYMRRNLKSIAISTIIFVIMALFVQGPLYSMLKVAPLKRSSSLDTQLHQVAAVIASNKPLKLSQSQIDYLSSILPLSTWKNSYYKGSINGITLNKEFNGVPINNQTLTFLKIWYTLGKEYPVTYFYERYYSTSVIWSVSNLLNPYVIQLGIVDNNLGLTSQPKLLSANSFITGMYNFTTARLMWLWLPALYLYAILVLVAVISFRRGRRFIIILSPIIFGILGLLISIPSQDIRYVYQVYLVVPFVLCLSFVRKGDASSDVQER